MNINWQRFLPKQAVERLEQKENFVKILANTFWLVSDRVIRMVVALLVGAWIARYLSPDNYGKLNNALAYVTLFGSFATLGFESILIRDIVKEPDNTNRLLGSGFYLRFIAGIATYICTALCIFLLKGEAGEAETRILVYIIGVGIIFQSFDVIDLYFQSQVKSKYTVFAKNSAFIIVSAIKVVMILMNASLTMLAIAWLLEMVLNAVGLIIVYHKKGFSVTAWNSNWPTMKYLLYQGFGFYIAYISTLLYMKVDQIMIGNMLNDREAGLFAASTKLYEIPFTLLLIIGSSVFPSLVNVYQIDIELFYKRLAQITGLITIGGLVVIILTWLFGSWGIVLIYGAAYTESYGILCIQIGGLYFLCLGALRSSFLSIISGQKILMISTVFAALFNLVANYYLIPAMGTKGAALATVITQFLSLVFINLLFAPTRRLFIIQVQAVLMIPAYKKLKNLLISKNNPL